MKTILLAATMLASAMSAAAADYSLPAMPKKFQGVWAEAKGGSCPLFINANTASHCDPSGKLKLLKIEPGDEELNTVTVTWVSGLSKTRVVYKVIKDGNRKALVSVNADDPTVGIGLYWRN